MISKDNRAVSCKDGSFLYINTAVTGIFIDAYKLISYRKQKRVRKKSAYNTSQKALNQQEKSTTNYLSQNGSITSARLMGLANIKRKSAAIRGP